MPITFRKQLRRWRKNRSQPEAAEILGVPLATYRNWEQGRNEPPEFALKTLLEIVGLTNAKTRRPECFEPLTPNPATKRWAVMSKDQGSQIGSVSWYGPWRKYCFMPMASTVFEQVCLRDIANFCETETKLHRASKSP